MVITAAAVFLLRDTGSDTELTRSEMTPEQLYAAVAQRLDGSDDILHVVTEATGTGPFEYSLRTEVWLDGRNEVVREEATVSAPGAPAPAVSVAITTNEERFEVQPGRPPTPPGADNGSSVTTSRYSICHDSGPAASSLLGCTSAVGNDVFEQHVEEGRRDGRDVLVLVTHTVGRGSDRTTDSTSRLYLDAETLLPLHAESEADWEGMAQPVVVEIEYLTVEFVARNSIAAGFFEPASIGWQARDPEAGMRNVTDLQPYWLGSEFVAPDGEVFVLYASLEAPGRGSPYRYSLQYSRKSAPHEPPFLSLQVFHLDMWERSPADRSQAIVLGDVVVFVIETALPGQQRILNQPGGLQAVFDALVPYSPSP